MKCAVYAVTRNYYDDVIPSIKSLLMHSDVEKVYVLIEDDVFPHELPKECECINVKDKRYFSRFGVNIIHPGSYMIMTRAALYDLLPDADLVLSLDADTIIDGDISELWDYPLGDNYFAATMEPDRCIGDAIYCNTGVALYNLEKLRDGTGDAVVRMLNNRRMFFYEQDAFNEVCKGRIAALPNEYNATQFTGECMAPKIVHYAGVRGWQHLPLVEQYRNVPWNEIRKPKRRRKNTRPSEVLPDNGRIYDEML